MKRNKKGSLILGVTMLGVVLLMFLLVELQINGFNSAQIGKSEERECALEAANAALSKAVADIEASHLNQKQTRMDISSLMNINSGLQPWKTLSGKNQKDDIYQYSYKISDGLITAYGRQIRNGKVKNIKKLTANYLIEYMGVSAKQIQYCPGTYKAAGISSVYSYATQYPISSWVGVSDVGEGRCGIDIAGTCSSRGPESDKGLVKQYILTNTENFYKTVQEPNSDSLYVNEYEDASFIDKKEDLFSLIKHLNLPEDKMYYAEDALRFKEIQDNCGNATKKGKKQINETVDAKLKKACGIPLSKWNDLYSVSGMSQIRPPSDKECDIWRFNPSEHENGMITGKNIWLTSLCGTVICNGDLILSRENPDDSNPDSYPVLIVGGSLIVNGAIRGTGTVIAMNNIYVSASNGAHSFPPPHENFNEPFNSSGALIVHAGNRLIIKNAHSSYEWGDCPDNSEFEKYLSGSANINSISNIDYIKSSAAESFKGAERENTNVGYPQTFCSFGFRKPEKAYDEYAPGNLIAIIEDEEAEEQPAAQEPPENGPQSDMTGYNSSDTNQSQNQSSPTNPSDPRPHGNNVPNPTNPPNTGGQTSQTDPQRHEEGESSPSGGPRTPNHGGGTNLNTYHILAR